MGKNKLRRFAENATFEHVVQPSFTELMRDGLALRGRWNAELFKCEAPIVLELGCGRGEYTVGLAQLAPEKNYIGVDIKGARIWRGARTAKELGLTNVARRSARSGSPSAIPRSARPASASPVRSSWRATRRSSCQAGSST
jgi:tRNA (guanine-N7-)-methyltransferase